MADKRRFVQLYTWWTSSNGRRQFCLVDKSGNLIKKAVPGGTVEQYETTQVKLIETLNPNPVNYAVDDFWDLVDRGKLVEYIPGVTVLPVPEQRPAEVPWRNPDNELFSV